MSLKIEIERVDKPNEKQSDNKRNYTQIVVARALPWLNTFRDVRLPINIDDVIGAIMANESQ